MTVTARLSAYLFAETADFNCGLARADRSMLRSRALWTAVADRHQRGFSQLTGTLGLSSAAIGKFGVTAAAVVGAGALVALAKSLSIRRLP